MSMLTLSPYLYVIGMLTLLTLSYFTLRNKKSRTQVAKDYARESAEEEYGRFLVRLREEPQWSNEGDSYVTPLHLKSVCGEMDRSFYVPSKHQSIETVNNLNTGDMVQIQRVEKPHGPDDKAESYVIFDKIMVAKAEA